MKLNLDTSSGIQTCWTVIGSVVSALLIIVAIVIFTMPEPSTTFSESSCRFEPYQDGICTNSIKGTTSQNTGGTTKTKYSYRVYDDNCGSKKLSLDDGIHEYCTNMDLETTDDNACWTDCDSYLYVLDDPTPETPDMTAGTICLTVGLVIIFFLIVQWVCIFWKAPKDDEEKPTWPSIDATPKSTSKNFFFFETDSGRLDKLPATYVAKQLLQVREEYSLESNPVCQIQEGTPVLIDEIKGTRAHIKSPVKGWASLSTKTETLLQRRTSRGN